MQERMFGYALTCQSLWPRPFKLWFFPQPPYFQTCSTATDEQDRFLRKQAIFPGHFVPPWHLYITWIPSWTNVSGQTNFSVFFCTYVHNYGMCKSNGDKCLTKQDTQHVFWNIQPNYAHNTSVFQLWMKFLLMTMRWPKTFVQNCKRIIY